MITTVAITVETTSALVTVVAEVVTTRGVTTSNEDAVEEEEITTTTVDTDPILQVVISDGPGIILVSIYLSCNSFEMICIACILCFIEHTKT